MGKPNDSISVFYIEYFKVAFSLWWSLSPPQKYCRSEENML